MNKGFQRVISVTPNTTESIFALGAGKTLVGRSRYCDFPPEAASVPVVGGYVDVSLETVLALQPDLVVGARGPSGTGLVDKLTEHGIKTYFPRTETVEEIFAMIEGLSDLLQCGNAGSILVKTLRGELAAIQASIAGEPKPRALLVFGLSPIVVAGPSSFPNEMLGLAGATNAIQTGPRYPSLGIEEVIAAKADIIIDAAIAEGHGKIRVQKQASGWGQVPAVQADKVFALQDDSALRPGPRVATGVRAMAKLIHRNVPIP
jgi:iron complex transport system substrate-binding protein